MSSSSIRRPTRYKLVFFTPLSALPAIKSALFDAGAGTYPDNRGPATYTEVMWTSARGTGQFRPGPGADPHIGRVGQLTEVEEVRAEVLCVGEDCVGRAVEAVRRTHPYEEPAYEVYKLEEF